LGDNAFLTGRPGALERFSPLRGLQRLDMSRTLKGYFLPTAGPSPGAPKLVTPAEETDQPEKKKRTPNDPKRLDVVPEPEERWALSISSTTL